MDKREKRRRVRGGGRKAEVRGMYLDQRDSKRRDRCSKSGGKSSVRVELLTVEGMVPGCDGAAFTNASVGEGRSRCNS